MTLNDFSVHIQCKSASGGQYLGGNAVNLCDIKERLWATPSCKKNVAKNLHMILA